MKKSLKALLAAAVISTSVCAMAGAASAATYVPQKTVTYNESDGKWVKDNVITTSYNKKGQVLKITSVDYYKGKAKTTYVTTYTYRGGKLTKSVTKENKKLYETTTYSIKNGRIAKLKYKFSSGEYGTYTYTYDKKGRLIKGNYKDKIGDIFDVTQATYSKFDSHGNPRKMLFEAFGGAERSTHTYKYTYNKKGALTQKLFYENSVLYKKEVYSKFKKIN